jgi:hypothetical protein
MVSPQKLQMEQSQICKFRVYNLSAEVMDLKLHKTEQDERSECLITDIKPQELGVI